MNVPTIKQLTNTTALSGLFINLICLIGIISPWFSILAILVRGIAALIYLFNIAGFILLVIYRGNCKGQSFYFRNLILIISYLIIYPLIFDKTTDIL
ncbi:hypothetical protein ACOJQI_12745 [Bacillus salacetis]|uniref:hypothetical protein n=1 Tax=Bacillus salacetis TaxID=2315464 RepID=UPI003B9EEF8E